MKTKKSITNFPLNKLPLIAQKLSNIIEENTTATTSMSLLNGSKKQNGNLLLADRYLLTKNEFHEFSVTDTKTNGVIYQELARVQTALSLIVWLLKNPNSNIVRSQHLIELDKRYKRCLNDVVLFRQKIESERDIDRRIMFANRLEQSEYTLLEIKNQLKKNYC
jgi:hypothetical protein